MRLDRQFQPLLGGQGMKPVEQEQAADPFIGGEPPGHFRADQFQHALEPVGMQVEQTAGEFAGAFARGWVRSLFEGPDQTLDAAQSLSQRLFLVLHAGPPPASP